MSGHLRIVLNAALVLAFVSLLSARRATALLIQSPVNAIEMEFVEIPAGEFMMGCSKGDTECTDREQPAHRVRITKAFEMAKFEVTQKMWKSVMQTGRLYSEEFPGQFIGERFPVYDVSWNETQDFLSQLNTRNDGYRYRLPTEAEWEYAARAGRTDAYATSLDSLAWYGGHREIHAVGQKLPNAWELYDMLGNVSEWVQDWFDAEYYAHSPGTDPSGPPSGQFKLLRGGSWNSIARDIRVSYRTNRLPTVGGARAQRQLGFRIVRDHRR